MYRKKDPDAIVDVDITSKPTNEYVEKISYEDYELQTHQIEFCIKLNKLKFCRLLKDEGNAHTFNQRNYVFIIIVNYFDWMYRFKKTAKKADADKFGKTFNTEEENYTLFNIIKKCCKDKEEDNNNIE
ncbi:9556_t:CDS:2, partial [Cetraspora pellucida]